MGSVTLLHPHHLRCSTFSTSTATTMMTMVLQQLLLQDKQVCFVADCLHCIRGFGISGPSA